MEITIQVFTDGENESFGTQSILNAWKQCWQNNYTEVGSLDFEVGLNLKQANVFQDAPEKLREIALIRNPDLSFVIGNSNELLGGIEITTHSPDGSNVEKRYPYLWASGRNSVHGFVLCPYQKTRPTGASNKLPGRHAKRNQEFLEEWTTSESHNSLLQIVPTLELQTGSLNAISQMVRDNMLSLADIGSFFAHALALKLVGPNHAIVAALERLKTKFNALAEQCSLATRYTEPSSLIKLENKWIQIYNTRPDSGHWERGEGQFDSIDGRLMFTLDEIHRLPASERPSTFEFWLPQMISNHPWIMEQISRGYGSKRIRNILQELRPYCTTKFADQLTHEDWELLKANPRLLLERLDWEPAIHKVASLTDPSNRENIARKGLTNQGDVRAILAELNREDLYFSSHKAYEEGWLQSLSGSLLQIPSDSTVLIPRIPEHLLEPLISTHRHRINIIPAERCSKIHLLTLRQLHREKK